MQEGKCLTACVPPMEADRPEPLAEEEQTSRGVVDGPGKLVVCGGSCNNARGVFDKMLELARQAPGGLAKMAWIPSNWDMRPSGQGGPLWDNTEPWKQTDNATLYADFEKFKALSGWWGDGRPEDKLDVSAGESLIIVHTTSKEEANSAEFANLLADRTGAWMRGGRQWRGMDVWGGTKAEQALHDMLNRGGVFGGTSAGASIQGDFLVRGQSVGANNNYVVVGDYQVGFGFVHKVAIDQHNTQRRRNGALLDWIEMNQEYLGISIDENTFIVVEGDELEVFGENVVEIVDATLWQEENFCSNQGLIEGLGRPLLPHREKFFYMKPKSLGAEFGQKYSAGERYNIRTREVTFANSR